MTRPPVALAMALLGGLAACGTPPYSEAPVATNFARLPQLKPQSSAHWSLIAKDVVDQLRPTIGNHPVFVRKPREETEFARVFHAQLISALSVKGVRVSKEPRYGVASVDVDAQLVRFSPGRYQNRHFTSAVAITTGLWALYGLNPSPRTAQVIGTEAIAATIDWDSWFNSHYASGATPQHELVVTASVSNETQILGQRTDVYYIADGDRPLYQLPPPAPPPPPKMMVTGGD